MKVISELCIHKCVQIASQIIDDVLCKMAIALSHSIESLHGIWNMKEYILNKLAAFDLEQVSFQLWTIFSVISTKGIWLN